MIAVALQLAPTLYARLWHVGRTSYIAIDNPSPNRVSKTSAVNDTSMKTSNAPFRLRKEGCLEEQGKAYMEGATTTASR